MGIFGVKMGVRPGNGDFGIKPGGARIPKTGIWGLRRGGGEPENRFL